MPKNLKSDPRELILLQICEHLAQRAVILFGNYSSLKDTTKKLLMAELYLLLSQ